MSDSDQNRFDSAGQPGRLSPLQFPNVLIPEGFLRRILTANLDSWLVRVHNRRTDQIQHQTYRAESADDAETFALNDALAGDPEGFYGVSARMHMGVRKLWDVCRQQPAASLDSIPRPHKPDLLGRVVAVDEEEAIELARELIAACTERSAVPNSGSGERANGGTVIVTEA